MSRKSRCLSTSSWLVDPNKDVKPSVVTPTNEVPNKPLSTQPGEPTRNIPARDVRARRTRGPSSRDGSTINPSPRLAPARDSPLRDVLVCNTSVRDTQTASYRSIAEIEKIMPYFDGKNMPVTQFVHDFRTAKRFLRPTDYDFFIALLKARAKDSGSNYLQLKTFATDDEIYDKLKRATPLHEYYYPIYWETYPTPDKGPTKRSWITVLGSRENYEQHQITYRKTSRQTSCQEPLKVSRFPL
ncbi:hypothetical protein TKK_0013714 [Trichogramma kaykai]|uniref:Uncharacterized protein n=1 Tax=Trichogramma kaykai TaxID=54128 RepID=A0ABD2WI47_9HYME